eukprot:3143512-Rhodomonas_salina.2
MDFSVTSVHVQPPARRSMSLSGIPTTTTATTSTGLVVVLAVLVYEMLRLLVEVLLRAQCTAVLDSVTENRDRPRPGPVVRRARPSPSQVRRTVRRR